MITDEQCLSPHVAPPHKNCMRLRWHLPFKGVDRVRVLLWTCPCKAVVYELCQAGGQVFIRRTLQHEDGSAVHETFRWSLSEACKVWSALLTGQAR